MYLPSQLWPKETERSLACDQAQSEEASEGKASPRKGQDTVLVPGVSGHPREKDRKRGTGRMPKE